MKKYLFSLLVILVSSGLGFAQIAKPFKLHGKFSSNAPGYIYLIYPDIADRWKKDSVMINKGSFIFTGLISQPTVARLSYKKEMVSIILEPAVMGVTVENEKDLSSLNITGSKSQQELSELNTALKKVESRWKIVMDTLNVINKRSNAAFQEYKGWVLSPYFKEIEEINHEFINKYPTSVATADMLQIFGRDLTTQTLQKYYNRFSPSLKQSRYGKNIAKQLTERKLGIPGTIAPIFAKEDINGMKLSLTDLKGKYVLLDFWGSWCVPCRKGNPHLIDMYRQYKTKGFEIVGVAADDARPDAWRKAVSEDKLPWMHILEGDLSQKYNVIYYPTKILIDKEGKIIGRFGEEHEPLDAMLKKIFPAQPL